MSQQGTVKAGCGCFSFPYIIPAIPTAVLAYHLNSGWTTPIWMALDTWLWPIAWIKWLCFGQITKDLFQQAFPFLF